MRKQPVLTTALVVAGLALVASSFDGVSTSSRASSGALSANPTPAALGAVRTSVEHWLTTAGFNGFRVSEVMAFSDNDYVAVNDKKGKAAFELLVAPDGRSWLMEEPASMMWNTRYGMLAGVNETLEPIPGLGMMLGGAGMMGSPSSWYSRGAGKVSSPTKAAAVANDWLAQARPGEVAEMDGRAFPGYFTFDTKDAARHAKTVGMLSVRISTGAVWYHGWHGTFRNERQFAS
jgi:hypothetical protein